MFQTIIIGIDGRPQDAETLALAQQLAEPGAEIIAAKIGVVNETLLRGSKVAVEAELLDQAEEVVDAFTEPHMRTEGVVTSAPSVGLGLREVAIGASADLIVVASSRRGLVGRMFAGDAVKDVLRHAPCPVAVAPVGHHAEGPLTRITVGYDGTDEAREAIEEAARLADRDKASISVVAVVEPVLAGAALAGVYAGPAFDDAYQRARENLDEVAQRYDVKGVITTGRTAHELAEASRSSDLLCIGLHNYDLLDRMLVGSTSHALLREQSAPLLVTPPTGASRDHRPVADALDVTTTVD